MITIKNMARVVRYEASMQQGTDRAKAKALGYAKVVPLNPSLKAHRVEYEARARVLKRAQELDW